MPLVFPEILYQHVGYLIILIAFAIKDMFRLRIVFVIAQICLLAYTLFIKRYDIAFWHLSFILVNIVYIISLINENKRVFLPKELLDIYDNIFNDFTTKEFLFLWSLGTREKSTKQTIIHEGAVQKNLFFILSGVAEVTQQGQLTNHLKRGSFAGEISFITKEPAIADVMTTETLEYLVWNQNSLRKLEKSYPALFKKLNHVIAKDMSKKLKQTDKLINLH